MPPLTTRVALTTWQLLPAVTASIVVVAGLYGYGAWRVGRRHPRRPWPLARCAAFYAGLLVVAIALESSVGVYDDVLFTDHMVQHLLLVMVAPPLLIFGRPITLLLHASRNPLHSRVKRVLRSRAVTVITCPPAALGLYVVVITTTHLTPFMNLVLENQVVHDAEHVLYLVTGYLYFLPIIGSEPFRWRISMMGRYLLLMLAMPADAAVGVTLMITDHELFPAYADVGRTWGPSLVGDLNKGGVVMWIGSDIVMTVLAVAVSVPFVLSRSYAGSVGSWIERGRRRALARQLLAAGVDVPSSSAGARAAGERAAGVSVDDDAEVDVQLAAYNAYLGRLDTDPSLVNVPRPRRASRLR